MPSRSSAHESPNSAQLENETTLPDAEIVPGAEEHHDHTDRSTEGADSRQEENAAQLTNPLVHEQPEYAQNSNGRLLHFGHSSTWAFTQQLLDKTNQTSHNRYVWNEEASVYLLNAERSLLGQDDIKGLPSSELAMFYMHAVKFRTCPLYYLFDDGDFTFHLRRFYSNVLEYAQQHRIWFVHYLVIMAFGKTFNTNHNAVTAGLTLFSRALRLLPDTTVLCQDPVPSTELLSSIALYLQSVDHRAAAHLYVSECTSHNYGELILVDWSSNAPSLLTWASQRHANSFSDPGSCHSRSKDMVDYIRIGQEASIDFRSTSRSS